MLVVVTNREDLTADWLVVELDRRAACFLRLNTEDYPASSRLRWTLQEASLEIHGQLLAAQDVTAVWWRRPLPPNGAGEGRSAAEAEWASGEAEAALEGFWSATSPRWVNHPTANASADCKPAQLRRAVGTGFRVPPTLVTNDAEAIRDFARREGRVVIKFLGRGGSPSSEQSTISTHQSSPPETSGTSRTSAQSHILFKRLSRSSTTSA